MVAIHFDLWLTAFGTFFVGVAAVGTLMVSSLTRKTYRATTEIRSEFKTNGGSSARDIWERLELAVTRLDVRLTAVEEHVTNPKELP